MLDPQAQDYISKRNAAIVDMVLSAVDGISREDIAKAFGLTYINALTVLKTLRARKLIASAQSGKIAVWCSVERAKLLQSEIKEDARLRKKIRDINRVRPRWRGKPPANKIEIDPPMVHRVVSDWDGPAPTQAANSIWAHAQRMAA